jgi:parallel beta-helix repeat protein
MNRKFIRGRGLAAIGSLAIALVVSTLSGGPLDPPAGPVSSTHKTLSQIEPRRAMSPTSTPGDANSVLRISASGSYYLMENLSVPAGFHGIEVIADNVTIDLNGFQIVGEAGSLTGIIGDGSPRSVVIRNGNIVGMGGAGINMLDGIASDSVHNAVDRVAVSGCGGSGFLAGNNTTVRDSVFRDNGANGIFIGTSSLIERCVSNDNGLTGVVATAGSVVADCTADGNDAGGISVGIGSLVRDCGASNNGGSGIVVQTGSTVLRCRSVGNTGAGFEINNSSVIGESIATTNRTDGIFAAGDCLIRGNTLRTNGLSADGAGILVSGSDTRIESNVCQGNAVGIRVTSSGNFIARNLVGANTSLNWDVVANNKCLVVKATLGGAITGSSGGVDPGSSSPNVNFSY